MLCIDHINIKNKKILIRVDFNVPIINGKITDISRIQASIPTIKYALEQNAGVILISHLGDPVIHPVPDYNLSLKIILPVLEDLLQTSVKFSNNLMDRQPIYVSPQQVVLCENIRFISEETTNDNNFAKYLASLADLVIMDAFAAAHRKHASTYGILNYATIAAAGFLLNTEINNLQNVLSIPDRPLVAIVGGSKIATKLGLIQSLLPIVDHLFIGGAIANTCLLAKGHQIGKSLFDPKYLDLAANLISNSKVLLPTDAIVLNKDLVVEAKKLELITELDCIMDIGEKTYEQYEKIIKSAKTVLWNGPIGKSEDPRFINGTRWLADLISNHKCFSIVGGGDTGAVLEQFKLNNFSYVSTGGGAFLEFIEKRTLPMLELLNKFK